ncbi:zinc finger protein 568-like isoform X2 [Diorhabda carinulata]|uniref:zinc finger protein 568-like isoform X2 n=1 Tax=Diorhabda sublineata TaxID=1163346 RepID=UPI0024E11869|nr:zinc finger protein 568-like isoform X2 [Diorhabda sublineata]XP_057672140.1 zinc finger protein 568-like isoform X2 [Diorhabda carinulata]
MENKDNRETLENIVIGDGTSQQFMIQRVPENAQLLSTELLQQQHGLVVDLGTNDFIPVSYSSEDLLSQDLTEEDRNLAAALVAVQLSQQQKQQQLQDTTLPSLVATSNLGTKILEEPQLIISNEKGGGTSFLRIVNTDNIYVEQQPLPKLVDTVRFTTVNSVGQSFNDDVEIEKCTTKKEEEKVDSDRESLKNEPRTSKKSLPHKKRISRKLKKNSVTSVKKIICNLCEQSFSSNDEFAQHEMLCQTTITPVNPANAFNCQICNEPFTEQLKFFEHLKKHYEPGGGGLPTSPLKTTSVDKKPSPEKLCEPNESERQESLLSSLLNLTCIECNKTFRRQKTFEAHMRDIHTSKNEPLDEFSEPEDLMEGITMVVDTNEPEPDEDDSKAWYREEEIHQTEEDLKELECGSEHICHLCNQPFPLRAILLQHLVTCRSTSGNTESAPLAVVKKINKKNKKKATHECNECDRVFTHKNSLVYHMRSHSGIRPHQCDQCGKSFFASSALKVHLRLHSGDKPYSCEHCGKRFRQWGDLKYHITSLHSTEKNFQCEYCGKEFARKYSLVVHRRIHTGERNYKCEFCGKSFRASSYLQNHRKIHTGEKPHMCGVCGKPFRVRSDMKRHQKTHSKGPTTASKNLRPLSKIEKVEIIEEEELSSELHIEDEEAAGQLLTEYTQEELEDGRTVRVPNRNLYINGHELFLVTYPNEIRAGEPQTSTAAWVHAPNA